MISARSDFCVRSVLIWMGKKGWGVHSKAFSFLTDKNASGLYHVVGSSSHTPLEASLLIAEKFGLNKSLILPCARSDFYQNRAPRPCYLRISNDKIKKLGIIMRGFPGVLAEIKP